MAEFFAELKRRQIYRVGAAYAVAAWVLTQVIEILAQVFTLPLWIAQTAIEHGLHLLHQDKDFEALAKAEKRLRVLKA